MIIHLGWDLALTMTVLSCTMNLTTATQIVSRHHRYVTYPLLGGPL